jgi:cystinosin
VCFGFRIGIDALHDSGAFFFFLFLCIYSSAILLLTASLMIQSPEMIALAKAISRLVGWAYVLCWSLSFYPQPINNWKRKSTQGLAIDFPTMNLLGFTSYTISTGAFLFSPTIRSQYAHRHPLSPETTVRFNDFAFAAHALVMCFVGYSQFWPSIWGFNVGLRQRVSRVALALVASSILLVIFMIFYIGLRTPSGGNDSDDWAWIDLVSTLIK